MTLTSCSSCAHGVHGVHPDTPHPHTHTLCDALPTSFGVVMTLVFFVRRMQAILPASSIGSRSEVCYFELARSGEETRQERASHSHERLTRGEFGHKLPNGCASAQRVGEASKERANLRNKGTADIQRRFRKLAFGAIRGRSGCRLRRLILPNCSNDATQDTRYVCRQTGVGNGVPQRNAPEGLLWGWVYVGGQ